MEWKITPRKGLLWTVITLTLIAGVAFVASSRAGYGTAAYEVIKKDGKFEIRKYAAHTVVTAPMKGNSQNGSFGKLFQYISGNNEAGKKIAMTTPVFMPADDSGTTREMQFVVPGEIAEQGAPTPNESTVRLKKMEGGRYATIRYSGRNKPDDMEKKLGELKEKMKSEGLTAAGNPVFAGYDPPWTPGPMRRNEVLLKVK